MDIPNEQTSKKDKHKKEGRVKEQYSNDDIQLEKKKHSFMGKVRGFMPLITVTTGVIGLLIPVYSITKQQKFQNLSSLITDFRSGTSEVQASAAENLNFYLNKKKYTDMVLPIIISHYMVETKRSVLNSMQKSIITGYQNGDKGEIENMLLEIKDSLDKEITAHQFSINSAKKDIINTVKTDDELGTDPAAVDLNTDRLKRLNNKLDNLKDIVDGKQKALINVAITLSKLQNKAVNLFRASLSSTDLTFFNLEGANLSEAKLNGADLNSSNLKKANLCNAQLVGGVVKIQHISSILWK